MAWFTILLFVQTAVSFAVTRLPIQTEELLVPTTTTATVTSVIPTTFWTATSEPTSITSQAPFSALITIAPLPQNPLEKRQCCWNDQGFRVDCAQWTGYYYTWGPPGDPYQGGPPGCGQSGGGGGGSSGGSQPGTVVVREFSTRTNSLTIEYDSLEVVPAESLHISPLTTYTEWDPFTDSNPSSIRLEGSSALTGDGSPAGQYQDLQPGNYNVDCTSALDVPFSTYTRIPMSVSPTQPDGGHEPEPELASATIVTCCNTSISPAQGSSLPSWSPSLFSFDASPSLTPTSTTTIRVRTTMYVTSNVTVSGPPPMQTVPEGVNTLTTRTGTSMTRDTYGPIGSFTVSPIPHAGGRVSTAALLPSAMLSRLSSTDTESTRTRTITLVKTVITTASPVAVGPSSSLTSLGHVVPTKSSSIGGFEIDSLQVSSTVPEDVSPDTTRIGTESTMPDSVPSPSKPLTASTSTTLPECGIVFGTSAPSTYTLGTPAVTEHASEGGEGGGGGGGGGARQERRAEAEAEAEPDSEAGRRPIMHTVVVVTLLSDGRMAPQASTLRTRYRPR
ncbi:hypothetical protein A1O7_08074 [Cladophialophora yegresii CBS 114405]|uniref:Uncharacterized protein n=1 Tax=Cladophialophora yegresii CBS 114405 TaxID=1182544 RepID=W9W9B3_9EURO|nr:uncharacterized protein A1O7_08074 [Cladophialophora yegresii CBS 114405]EXJ55149.1 hypothetical protein A1O7_08074 [Cladophialophora yegresii CBS 114405]